MADDFYHPNPHHDFGHSYNQIQEERKTYFDLISPGSILIAGFIILILVGAFTYYFFYIKPLNEQGDKCFSVSDCDDGNACTIDKCSSFTGICYHSNKKCPSREFCNIDNGICELIVESASSDSETNQPIINQTPQNSAEGCSSSSQCTISPNKKCLLSSGQTTNGTCVQCLTSSDCNTNGVTGQTCNSNNVCVNASSPPPSSGTIPPPPPLPS